MAPSLAAGARLDVACEGALFWTRYENTDEDTPGHPS